MGCHTCKELGHGRPPLAHRQLAYWCCLRCQSLSQFQRRSLLPPLCQCFYKGPRSSQTSLGKRGDRSRSMFDLCKGNPLHC
ncbi:hypothetical protein B296_00056999 [Ensete ventricosum]|uniref:Uncharacterized protein n=1 Tax=Ensete ventricosum TaxID=4639 RepID=A0A426X2D2_ENSVE|nr:hypothetical protein B296_00056999 [Ensete ventricosum]